MGKSKISHSVYEKYRLLLILIGEIILILIIGRKFFILQIFERKKYNLLQKSNYLKYRHIALPRGDIIDRNNYIICSNKEIYNVILVMAIPWAKVQEILLQINCIYSITEKHVRIAKKNFYNNNWPIILSEIPWSYANKIINLSINNILIEGQWIRTYNYNDSTSHVIGYVGNNTTNNKSPYIYGSFVGITALEKYYNNNLLNGSIKKQTVINKYGTWQVNDKNNNLQTFFLQHEKNKSLHITIDLKLQEYLQQLINWKEYSLIISNDDGEIISLLSSPTFSSNEISSIYNTKQYSTFNKVLEGIYAPGSIIKIITTYCALDNNWDQNKTINCKGYYYVKQKRINCHNLKGHGPLNLQEALFKSCNVYFCHIGCFLTNSQLITTFYQFGLGNIVNFKEYKEHPGIIKKNITLFDRIIMCFGQGPMAITPIQALQMIYILKMGYKLNPKIIKDNSNINKFSSVTFNQDILKFIRNALIIKSYGNDIVIKTGTAQHNKNILSHGWSVAYSKNSPYIISLIMEKSGWGYLYAKPTIKKILRYLNNYYN